jgi:hypothetical protein
MREIPGALSVAICVAAIGVASCSQACIALIVALKLRWI